MHKLFPSPLSFIFLVSLKEEKGRIIKECEIEEARKEEGLKTLRLQMYSFKSEKNFNLLILYLLCGQKITKILYCKYIEQCVGHFKLQFRFGGPREISLSTFISIQVTSIYSSHLKILNWDPFINGHKRC